MAKSKKKSLNTNDFVMAARNSLATLSGNAAVKSLSNFNGVGIRMPLLMQYLMDVRAYPLGLLTQIIGEEASRKTTVLLEIGRWFIDCSGYHDLTVTEGKFSESLAHSLYGYPDELVDQDGNIIRYPFDHICSTNMTEWQMKVSAQVSKLNKMMDEDWWDPASGNKIPRGLWTPTLFSVDSLVAQLTEKQSDTVEAQGGADRGFATHIKALSEWISQIQAAVTNRPHSIALINHCTVDHPTEYSTVIKGKGGRKLAFESSLIMFMKKVGSETKLIDDVNWAPEQNTTWVQMELRKSSVGNDKRKIVVPIREQIEIVGEADSRQRTKFLWSTGLVDLLMSYMYTDDTSVKLTPALKTAKAANVYRERFLPVVPIKKISSGRYRCEKYSSDEMDAEQLGDFLEQDQEFLRVFYEQFGIKPYDVWDFGVEYSEFVEAARDRDYKERVMRSLKLGGQDGGE